MPIGTEPTTIVDVIWMAVEIPLGIGEDRFSARGRMALANLIASGEMMAGTDDADTEAEWVCVTVDQKAIDRLMYAFGWSERKAHLAVQELMDAEVLTRYEDTEDYRFDFERWFVDNHVSFEWWRVERSKRLPLRHIIKS